MGLFDRRFDGTIASPFGGSSGGGGGSGANLFLSNLSSPTAINQNLISATNGSVTIYSNFPGNGVTTSDLNHSTVQIAAPFTPGISAAVLTASFGTQSAPASMVGNLFANIFADNSGSPGTLLGTSNALNSSTVTPGATQVNFTFGTPVSLTSGTPYWVGLSTDMTYHGSANFLDFVQGAGGATPNIAYYNTMWNSAPTSLAVQVFGGGSRNSIQFGLIESVNSGFKFPDGSIQLTAATGGVVPLSGITAATSSPTAIDSLNFLQQWNWSTLTSGPALTLATANPGFTGTLFQLTASNASNTGTVLGISASGATSVGLALSRSVTTGTNGFATITDASTAGATGLAISMTGATGAQIGANVIMTSNTLAATGLKVTMNGASQATLGIDVSNVSTAGGGSTFGIRSQMTNGSANGALFAIQGKVSNTHSGSVAGDFSLTSATATGTAVNATHAGTSGSAIVATVNHGATGLNIISSSTASNDGIQISMTGATGAQQCIYASNASNTAGANGIYLTMTGSSAAYKTLQISHSSSAGFPYYSSTGSGSAIRTHVMMSNTVSTIGNGTQIAFAVSAPSVDTIVASIAGIATNVSSAAGALLFMTATGGAAPVENMRLASDGSLLFPYTISGGTGAQTINHISGTVNFAGAATSLVVTNSLVSTSSIVFAVIRTADATAQLMNVVPAAGSFTINMSVAPTGTTSVGFFVINK